MAQRRLYLGIENIALTVPQQQALVDGLKTIGLQNDPSPAKINHWRIRLDGDGAIFEAEFDDANFTVNALRQRLATIFGVLLAQVTNATTNPAAGTVLTMSYQSVARVRFVVFGGSVATYQESQNAVRAYLAASSAQWELDT